MLIVLSNQRISPYKKSSNDVLMLRGELLKGPSLPFIRSVTISLWLYTGSWTQVASYQNNRYGNNILTYSCSGLNVSSCKALLKVTLNGATYESNVLNINFI